jgi:nitrogen fixation/metabolism regulation signal transduction histidine kinase
MEAKLVRRRFTTALILVAVALVVGGLVLLREISSNSDDFGRLYRTILIVNSIGASVLLLLIGANLVRLFRDHRRDVPGARLKSRLVGAFVLLVFAPMAVVYLYSVQFLSEGIDSWFDIEVEQGLGDALELSRNALSMSMRDDLARTRSIADAIYSVGDPNIYAYLPDLRSESNASEVSVFAGGSRIIATSSNNPLGRLPLMPTDELLLSLRRNSYYVALEPQADDEYIVRTAVLLPARSGGDIRILQALYPLEKGLGPLATSVEATVSRYAELSFLRGPLKGGYIVTLSIVVLVTLLVAVYGAFIFARRLSAPVQNLVAGTRAVARGDFDTRLPSGGKDEIGFLVDSFNDMIEQLGSARAEARRSAAQVENERANVEAILARLSTGVVALEENLTIRMANQAAEGLLNLQLRGREGEPVATIGAESQPLQQILEVVQRHLDNDEVEWREQISLQLDTGTRVLVCASTALPGSYRSRGGLVLVFDDITELLQAQRDAAWGEVARRLAHEIKNPLTPIQLSAERIRRKVLGSIDEPTGKILDRATHTIVQQVEAMRDMVNAFSEYARAPEMNRTNFDLNHLITQVADLYPGQKGQSAVALDLDPDLPKISADAVRIRQVLHNLVRNALEALDSQDDGVVQVITHQVENDKGKRIRITVKDNGPGIPAADRDRIFEPYVTTKGKGTGLGLAIVKRLVEEHGGEVIIDSQVGLGTAVDILLPFTGSGETDVTLRDDTRERRQRA